METASKRTRRIKDKKKSETQRVKMAGDVKRDVGKGVREVNHQKEREGRVDGKQQEGSNRWPPHERRERRRGEGGGKKGNGGGRRKTCKHEFLDGSNQFLVNSDKETYPWPSVRRHDSRSDGRSRSNKNVRHDGNEGGGGRRGGERDGGGAWESYPGTPTSLTGRLGIHRALQGRVHMLLFRLPVLTPAFGEAPAGGRACGRGKGRGGVSGGEVGGEVV